jgi:hypothetical protein
MIAIVSTRPSIILGRQYLWSPQTEPSIFIFWENITYCSKKYHFFTAFQLRFKRYLQKEKTSQAISYGDRRPSALRADRRLATNIIEFRYHNAQSQAWLSDVHM